MTPTVPVNDPPRVFRPLDPPFPTPSGRPSWSGLLQLNLVGIPLKAYPAVRQREAPAFHQLHAGCGQRIRCPKHCPVHGPVDSAALVRAYEYGPGQHVILEADEVDQLRPAQDRALRLEHFLSPADCDPLFYAGRSLYLLPDGPAAVHGYLVLHAVLVQRDRWALGKIVLGGQRQVALVRPTTDVLVLHVLHYPELVRACPAPGVSPRPTTPQELQLAGQLVDAASGAASASAYRDETAAELRALVEAKLQGQGLEASAPPPQLLPFLEALQQSVATLSPPPRAKPPAPGPGAPAAQTAEGVMLPQVLPMLAVSAAPFDASDYLFEVKWDGVRALAAVDAHAWRLWGRRGSDYTTRYPEWEVLAADQVTHVAEPFGLGLTMVYDAAGNRTKVTDSLGGVATSVYDAANRLSTREFGDTSGAVLRYDYSYTADDQIASLTHASNLAGTTHVGVTSMAYDAAGRTTLIQQVNGSSSVFQTTTYSYDAAGRMTAEKTNGTTTSYSYDAANQLTAAGATTYAYDSAGNRTSGGSSPSTGNQISQDANFTYSYDADGNRTGKTSKSDGSRWVYAYNAADQMTLAEHFDSSDVLLSQVTYVYDAWGKLIERDDYEASSGTGDGGGEDAMGALGGFGPDLGIDIGETIARFGQDGWKVSQDFWGNRPPAAGLSNFDVWVELNATSGSNVLATRRFYGDGVDTPVARINYTSGVGAVAWYFTDVRDSVTAVANASGTVEAQISYDGFGNATITGANTTYADAYQYTGRPTDAATGLQDNRGRWYDPTTGTFTVEDPTGFNAGDYNLMRYTGNDPTNGSDPSGLHPPAGRGIDGANGNASTLEQQQVDQAVRGLAEQIIAFQKEFGPGAAGTIRDEILLDAINGVRAANGLEELNSLDDVDSVAKDAWVDAGGAPLLVAYMLKHYGDRGAGDLYRRGVRAGFTIEPTTSYWCDASGVEVTGRKILITRYRNLVINWRGRPVDSAADYLFDRLNDYLGDNPVSRWFGRVGDKLTSRLRDALKQNGFQAEGDDLDQQVQDWVALIALGSNNAFIQAKDQAVSALAGQGISAGAAAIVGLTGRLRGIINLHHALPKFLGGFANQDLVKLDKAVHDAFHDLLRTKLKNAGFPLPIGGTTGSTAKWMRYFIENPGSQNKAFRIVLAASRDIDKKYATEIAKAARQALKGCQFVRP